MLELALADFKPKAEKKCLSKPMASGYNPIVVESAWYDWWDAQGFFAPRVTEDGRPDANGLFVVPLPPPTLNGGLHIGHALTIAIEDVLSRWNRMLGKTTLFIPGFDHGGISTETVVEKRLYAMTGRTRHSLGREVFLQAMQSWKNDHQEKITRQLRRLGGSCDWTRTAFTMDEKPSKAVVEAFCRLHEDGIIYRANRLVNWCVKLNTTLSELEVEQRQLNGRTTMTIPGYAPTEKFEFGVLIFFAYRIENSDEKIVVATTRPETMLADTAIAIKPNDPRYQRFHGKFATHPLVQRRIPIIMDDTIVDIEFGTGAVKISPAHNYNDYEVGLRHNLQFVNILNDDGTLNEVTGEKFKGMKRFHARMAVIQALKDVGLYVRTQEHPMRIPICRKSGDIVETMLKPQWWVKCKPLADAAIKRTRAGELSITPSHVEADWYRWLQKMPDWCISRQLWWGHRCPAYFVRIEGQVQDMSDGKYWVVGRTIEEATERAGILAGGSTFVLEQDEDILDTWFSSALWPFSIMGWPENTPDLQTFYPLSILNTGCDTLFSWVAPMVFLGVYFTGTMPFKEVFCHGMVRDSYGRKMGKSLGNGIDPLDIIHGLSLEALHEQLYNGQWDEAQIAKAKAWQNKVFKNGIPQCGTDALRFALCSYIGKGHDINLDVLRVKGYRKFCNKIFNATKFTLLKLSKDFIPEPTRKPTGGESLVERWIIHKLDIAAANINKQLAERNFMAATTSVYNFWLYELCNVYIEAVKPMTDEAASATTRQSAEQTLYMCLDHGLRLLHPFMPFVTEELWSQLPRRPNDSTPSIMVSSFPVSDSAFAFEEAHREFELVFSGIKVARSLAALYNIKLDAQLYFHAQTEREAALFESQVPTIVALIKGCKNIKVIQDVRDIPANCSSAVVTHTLTVYTPVQDVLKLNDKYTKLLDLAKLNLDKIKKMELRSDYEENVPTNVRLINEEKVLVNRLYAPLPLNPLPQRKMLNAEIKSLKLSINMFAKPN